MPSWASWLKIYGPSLKVYLRQRLLGARGTAQSYWMCCSSQCTPIDSDKLQDRSAEVACVHDQRIVRFWSISQGLYPEIVQYRSLNVFLMMMFSVKDVITPENILKQTLHEVRRQSACDNTNGYFQTFFKIIKHVHKRRSIQCVTLTVTHWCVTYPVTS